MLSHFSLHREAVEHFLTALNLQREAKGTRGSIARTAQMSESIWSTLRLAVSLMGRTDLQPLVQNRDLDTLMREFGVE